jgi:hypothetical protein
MRISGDVFSDRPFRTAYILFMAFGSEGTLEFVVISIKIIVLLTRWHLR